MQRALVLWVKLWSLSEFASLRWWVCEGTCGLRGVEEDKWFYYVGTAGPQSSDHVDTFCDREGLKDCKLSFPAFDIVLLKQKGTKILHSLLGVLLSIGVKLTWYSFCCS